MLGAHIYVVTREKYNMNSKNIAQKVHFATYLKNILYKLENSFGHTKISIFYDLLLNWNIPGIFQDIPI